MMNWLPDWLNPYNYEPAIYFDPDTFLDVLEKEPLAITAVTFSMLSVVLTVFFKLWDYWRDTKKDHAQQGKLLIELYPEYTNRVLHIVITNTGREPLVIRDIGFPDRGTTLSRVVNLQPRWVSLKHEQLSLPIRLNGKEFQEIQLTGDYLNAFLSSRQPFCVKDSLGQIWTYRGAGLARLKANLKNKNTNSDHQPLDSANVTVS